MESSLIGVRPNVSRRDKLAANAMSGALGAAVSAPAYVLGRVALLMLGSKALLVPGIVVVAIGFALQAGDGSGQGRQDGRGAGRRWRRCD